MFLRWHKILYGIAQPPGQHNIFYDVINVVKTPDNPALGRLQLGKHIVTHGKQKQVEAKIKQKGTVEYKQAVGVDIRWVYGDISK